MKKELIVCELFETVTEETDSEIVTEWQGQIGMWDYYITFAVYTLLPIRNILKTIKSDSK